MADGRDKQGRFTPGNPGGPGRPSRETEFRYLIVIGDSVSLDDWREIVEIAVTGAKNGDQRDRAWLSKYLVGHSSVTADEIDIVLKDASMGRFWREMAEAETANTGDT
ncbi:MAG: hypothetical protein ACC700_19135 [Anaerolineales bacterium]